MAHSNQLMTEASAADYVAVPRRTLTQWRYLGEGPPFVRVGKRHIRYRRADLDAWLDANTVRPSGDAA